MSESSSADEVKAGLVRLTGKSETEVTNALNASGGNPNAAYALLCPDDHPNDEFQSASNNSSYMDAPNQEPLIQQPYQSVAAANTHSRYVESDSGIVSWVMWVIHGVGKLFHEGIRAVLGSNQNFARNFRVTYIPLSLKRWTVLYCPLWHFRGAGEPSSLAIIVHMVCCADSSLSFYDGQFVDLVSLAKESDRLVFVVITNSSSQQDMTSCRLLLNELTSDLLKENFLLFGDFAHSVQGRQLLALLEQRSGPVFAVLKPGETRVVPPTVLALPSCYDQQALNETIMSVIESSHPFQRSRRTMEARRPVPSTSTPATSSMGEARRPSESIIPGISPVPRTEATRAVPAASVRTPQQDAIDERRRLREEQDREYQEMLARDLRRQEEEKERIAREKAAAEEEETRRNNENRKAELKEVKRRECLSHLSQLDQRIERRVTSFTSPQEKKTIVTTISIRLPSGKKAQRDFLRDESVTMLYEWVYSLEETLPEFFELRTSLPPVSYFRQLDSSLVDAGISSSILIVLSPTEFSGLSPSLQSFFEITL